MPSNLKFPPTVEIKRVLAATSRAGIEIGSIEIHPRKIVINPREKDAPALSDYDIWKMSEGHGSSRVGLPEKESGAQRGKSNT